MTRPSYQELENRVKNLEKAVVDQQYSEEMLIRTRFSIEYAIDSIYWLTSSGKIIDVNESACSMLGYSKRELLSMRVFDLGNEFPEDIWNEHWLQLKQEKNIVFEATQIHKNGDLLPVEINSNFVEFFGKDYVCSFVKDISARKKAEEALIESEEKYRDLTETMPISIFEIDKNGILIFANKHAKETFGVIGNSFENGSISAFDVIAPADRPRMEENMKRRFSGESLGEIEYTALKEDGTEFPVLMYGRTSVSDDNQLRIRGYLIDITERKKSEMIQSVLYNILDAAQKTTTVDELLKIVHAEIATLMDAKNFYVALYDKENDTYTFPYTADKYDKIDPLASMNIGGGYTDYIRRNKNPMILNPATVQSLLNSGNIELLGTRSESWMGAPLIKDDETIGVVAVQSYEDPDAYTNKDLDILTYVSGHITLAIERKQKEETINSSRQRMKLHIEQTPLAVIEWDLNFQAVEWNQSAEKIFEYSFKEAIGRHANDLIVPEDAKPHVDAVWEELLKITGGMRSTNENVTKSGKRIFCEWYNTPLVNENGVVIGVTSLALDITKRRKAEQTNEILFEISKAVNETDDLNNLYPQIRQSLHKIIDTDNFYIALYDRAADVIRFPYYTDEEDDDFEIYHALDTRSLTTEIIKTQKPLLINSKTLKAKYNKEELEQFGTLPLVWLGVPLIFENEVVGVIAVQSYTTPDLYTENDITLLESVSEQIASAIKMKISDQERRKLEEQLIHAQKMESIGRLAGGIAHDLNNILATIMGYSDMLRLEYDDTTQVTGRAADTIFKSTKRAKELINQLLGFARKGKFNPTPIDINRVTIETINVLEKIIQENIKIKYDFQDDLRIVEADKSQMEQVLTNIFINAKDAMLSGGEITVKTENIFLDSSQQKNVFELKDGHYVKISISDTGIGMPKKVMDRVFEPFYTTKSIGKGTGLGLAMVYGILKNHQGDIAVESISGKGTTFTIFLPGIEDEKNKQEIDFNVLSEIDTVLIIDDDNDFRNMLKNQIEQFGVNVLTGRGGIEGVSVFEKNTDKIDLVLLDMIMPDLSGNQVFKILKNIDPKVKVLLVSGYSQDDNANEILNEGAMGYIQKPVDTQQLSITMADSVKN